MSDYSQLAIVDVETTGLDADRHEIWEVALKLPFDGDHHWFLPVDLGRADPYSLNIGKFYERYPKDYKEWTTKFDFAAQFSELTRGRHLVGNVISFDEERLRRLLRNNRACPGWHYHLVDVEALVAGKLGIPPPWKSPDLSAAIGVAVPTDDEMHSAERDVRWAWEMYVAVMEGGGT